MDYTSIVLQNNQFKNLQMQIENNTVSHALLFKSADTDFLQSFCYNAATIFTGASLSRVQKGIHPDVFIYGLTKTDVDDINDIIGSLNVAPYESNYKVYILLNFNDVSETCQNKLLKSLEEPPKNVVFLLGASSTKKILSTILSRVKLTELDSLNTQQIYQMLVDSGNSKEVSQVAASICGGNSTLASKLTTEKFLDLYNTCLAMLGSINSSRDCLKFASKLEDKSIDKAEMLDVIIALVRDIMVLLSGNDSLVENVSVISQLKNISGQFSLSCCNNIISQGLQLKEDLYYNTNSTAVLDSLLMIIAQEKVKCKK